MEEKAKIFFVKVWESPPSAPVIAESIAIINNELLFINENLIINNGANFCQVNKIKDFIHDNPWITKINQAWNGAAPSLIDNAIIMMNIEK